METGRRSNKRKAEEVQRQQDHHWVGGNMHTKQEEGKKRKKKGEKKQEDANATHAVLEQKISEKKPKRIVCGGGEDISNVCTEQDTLKEHKQAQEDNSHDVLVDCNAHFDASKQQCKKVRFSDQFAPCKCKHNFSEEVCTRNRSVSKGSSANGCAGQAVSCRENSKELPFQDGSMNSNVGQVGIAVDEKSLFTRKGQKNEDDWIWGKRFTPEEDELLKNAVLDYIKVKRWEEKEGIDKVLNCSKHKEAHNCWGIIRLCLPHRPRKAIRARAYLLLEEGAHLGRWSKEEEELLKRLHKEHGNQWKYLSTLIGRSQYSISRKWRCLKRPKPTGVWTWDEMQQLSDSVHKCLRLRALGVMRKEKGNRKFLRDNISWDEVADAIGTHTHDSCCVKWYRNMSSSMVIDGLWASEDDCLLLKSLLESGACTEEEVEWHSLLIHRSGQACLLRWKQMVKYLGENRTREFLERLHSLAYRYAPELLSHE